MPIYLVTIEDVFSVESETAMDAINTVQNQLRYGFNADLKAQELKLIKEIPKIKNNLIDIKL